MAPLLFCPHKCFANIFLPHLIIIIIMIQQIPQAVNNKLLQNSILSYISLHIHINGDICCFIHIIIFTRSMKVRCLINHLSLLFVFFFLQYQFLYGHISKLIYLVPSNAYMFVELFYIFLLIFLTPVCFTLKLYRKTQKKNSHAIY